MLIVTILAAIVFYTVLYLIYESTQVRLDSAAAILGALERMIVVPELTIFLILRGLILAAIFYVVADFFVATARKAAKRRKDAEEPKLGWKKPPPR